MSNLLTVRNLLIAYFSIGAIVCLVHPLITRKLIADLKDPNMGVADRIEGTIVVLIVLLIWPFAWFNIGRSVKKAQEAELQEKARRKREGIRKRKDYGFVAVVDASEWAPEFNCLLTDWVEDEIRELLPGDTVLEYGWQPGPLCGEGGYAIERKGRIIAEHTAWVS